jgi:general secretion pathway protein K
MIVVTLVATLASAMLWRQWRSVEIEAAERSRSQASWVLSGALDWARLILREDRRAGGPDHLAEPWATPLAEARLSTFLAADGSNTDDATEAFLSSKINDAQARFNLNNIVLTPAPATQQLQTLVRLCDNLNIDAGVCTQLGAVLQSKGAAPSSGASAPQAKTTISDGPLMPPSSAQLRWLGLDEASSAALAPYVTILPRVTPVNINTAAREVLAAAMQIDVASADRLVQTRQRTPFRSLNDVQPLLPAGAAAPSGMVGVESDFFEVIGQLRIEHRVVEERSMVERRGLQVLTVSRERVGLSLATRAR